MMLRSCTTLLQAAGVGGGVEGGRGTRGVPQRGATNGSQHVLVCQGMVHAAA